MLLQTTTAQALLTKYKSAEASHTRSSFFRRLKNTIDSTFPEVAGCTQASFELCAVCLALWGLDVGHTADHTTFKELMALMAELFQWNVVIESLSLLFKVVGLWNVPTKMKALWFVACFGEGFCPLRHNKDLPLMPDGQARVMFSCMLLALPKDISGIMRLQLGMFLIPSIGWDIAAEMIFMSTPISTRRCMPQEWYNMGERDLRLELMLHDLEPAIGFWYPERRMVCPEAKAGIVAPAGQPSKPISFSQLFTISPDVGATNFLECAVGYKWPFQEAPSQQLKYFLQMVTFRFDRIAVDFCGVSQLFNLSKSEVTFTETTWPRTPEKQGAILVPLDVILARLHTTEMWKRCEAAEQQAADKRQRKNAAKRGKQGVVQKAEESQKPKQDHLRQPRLELFVERIDGNLPPVIQHLTTMLHEAKRLTGGTAHGELSSAYAVGRILQKGLRCRRYHLFCERKRRSSPTFLDWRLSTKQVTSPLLADEASSHARSRTGLAQELLKLTVQVDHAMAALQTILSDIFQTLQADPSAASAYEPGHKEFWRFEALRQLMAWSPSTQHAAASEIPSSDPFDSMPGLLGTLGAVQLEGQFVGCCGSSAADATGPDRIAQQLLKQLGPVAARVACTACEILYVLYEAIADQEDLTEHVRDDALNSLRMRFWQLRKAMAHDNQKRMVNKLLEINNAGEAGAAGISSPPPSFQESLMQAMRQATTSREQNRLVDQLLDADSPEPDIGGMDHPIPVIRESQVPKQLALVEAEITAIARSADAVQPSKQLRRSSAGTVKGSKETKDWPAALYERKWLRLPASGWEPHIDAEHIMAQGAQDMDALFEDAGLPFPMKPAPPIQQPPFPRSWVDTSRPGHEKLELELLGHIRRTQHQKDFLGLSDRWPLMALEDRLRCTLDINPSPGEGAILGYAVFGGEGGYDSSVVKYASFLCSHSADTSERSRAVTWRDCPVDLFHSGTLIESNGDMDWGQALHVYEQLSKREEQTAQAMLGAIPMSPQLDLRLTPSERRQLQQSALQVFVPFVQKWCTQGEYNDGGMPSEAQLDHASASAHNEALKGYMTKEELQVARRSLTQSAAKGDAPAAQQSKHGGHTAPDQLLDLDWSSAIARGKSKQAPSTAPNKLTKKLKSKAAKGKKPAGAASQVGASHLSTSASKPGAAPAADPDAPTSSDSQPQPALTGAASPAASGISDPARESFGSLPSGSAAVHADGAACKLSADDSGEQQPPALLQKSIPTAKSDAGSSNHTSGDSRPRHAQSAAHSNPSASDAPGSQNDSTALTEQDESSSGSWVQVRRAAANKHASTLSDQQGTPKPQQVSGTRRLPLKAAVRGVSPAAAGEAAALQSGHESRSQSGQPLLGQADAANVAGSCTDQDQLALSQRTQTERVAASIPSPSKSLQEASADPRERTFEEVLAELQAICGTQQSTANLRLTLKTAVTWLGIHAADLNPQQLLQVREKLQQAKTALRNSLKAELHQHLPMGEHEGGQPSSCDDDGLCAICLDVPSTIRFKPCNHCCACLACSKLILKADRICPLCRTPIAAAL